MADNMRFKEMVEYLKKNRYIRNQQDFTERVKSNKATVSQIMNNKISTPNIMFGNISLAFPFISVDWLKTGEGSMLKSPISQTANGDHNTQVAGNANHVNNSSTLDKALDEISQQRQLVEKSHELTANAQRQIDRLLAIIEKMQDK